MGWAPPGDEMVVSNPTPSATDHEQEIPSKKCQVAPVPSRSGVQCPPERKTIKRASNLNAKVGKMVMRTEQKGC